MHEQKLNQIYVFKKKDNGLVRSTFEPYTRIIIKDMPVFKQASLQFHFKNRPDLTRDELIFAKKEEIIVINFDT